MNKKFEYLLFIIGIIFLILLVLEIFQVRINYRMFQKHCGTGGRIFTGGCFREPVFIPKQ